MSTILPVITVEDLTEGAYAMDFHSMPDPNLDLDGTDAFFSVYTGGARISRLYDNNEIGEDRGDRSSFRVDVNLIALYLDGIITEEEFRGGTGITIFLFADLKGISLNGSRTSIFRHRIFHDERLPYTSNCAWRL